MFFFSLAYENSALPKIDRIHTTVYLRSMPYLYAIHFHAGDFLVVRRANRILYNL